MYKKVATATNKLKWLEGAKESAELAIFFQKKAYLEYKGFNINIKCQLCGYEDDLVIYQSKIYGITQKAADLEQIFSYMERFKGKLLLEYFTENPLPTDLAETEYTITKNISDYKQKIALATADSLPLFEKKLFDESQKMEKFIQTVSENHPEHANFFYNKNYTSAGTLQNTLDDNTAFVSYIITGNKLVIYLINNDKQERFEINIEDNFYEKISQYIQLLENPLLVQTKKRNQFIQLSHQLYQDLLQPLEAYIKDKKSLIISPNNDLFNLPFETLLASNKEKSFLHLNFLLKQFAISYQYSATTYQRLQKQSKIKDKSFIGFAPIFENGLALNEQTRALSFVVDSLYRSIDNNKLQSLPNTKIEIVTISNLLPSTVTNKVLLNKTATKKAAISAMNKEVQFLHIATHGLVNFDNPNLSALACYNEDDYEGNFLFANEIQNSNIKADLVILSSCESGIGQQIDGEGLIALNRSFIIGGANNVIFSLWKVNDEYSSQLMIDFYKFYLDNLSYTTSLRQTKLKMLQNPITANPRFWAAFVLIGE
jgi:CHAT domain-containing protein